MRYKNENKTKNNGIVYTPSDLATFLAQEMLRNFDDSLSDMDEISILDPAIGDGALIIALVTEIQKKNPLANIIINGYDTEQGKALSTQRRLKNLFPRAEIEVFDENFLERVDSIGRHYDFIIANPPYVRTQILGSTFTKALSRRLNLRGRVDLYYAFLVCMKQVLKENGVCGYITSNKFLTIKSGEAVRRFMLANYLIHSVFDFGDTKLFNAAVLPCVIVFSLGKTEPRGSGSFTAIYEDKSSVSSYTCGSLFEHIHDAGVFHVRNDRTFKIQQGTLGFSDEASPWVLTSKESSEWLETVEANTWKRFSDIGRIRVGIKTTADNVFIGNDWTGDKARIELLRPLITHRNAGQIIGDYSDEWKVLYPHTVVDDKRAVVDIDKFPCSKGYLLQHYEQLAGRTYLQKANRQWFEIWVPQNPLAWSNRKIVFRDISERPEFWFDDSGAVVNGDCYWIDIDNSVSDDLIYLVLAVANSRFIEKYYDTRFNTKLYAGKRRFMTQYVEQFPIPCTNTPLAKEAARIVQSVIAKNANVSSCMNRINELVDKMFGVAHNE